MTRQMTKNDEAWTTDAPSQSLSEDGASGILRAALTVSAETAGLPQTLSTIAAWMMANSASPSQKKQ